MAKQPIKVTNLSLGGLNTGAYVKKDTKKVISQKKISKVETN